MPVSVNTAWEVRAATGSDNNGGGFVAGASGTDYSQQDTPQYALTGLVSAGTGNVLLYAGASVDMVGNIAQAISGTNINPGSYEILSVSLGVSITFSTNKTSQSICTGIAASVVINIGGALATIDVADSGMSVSNKIFATGGFTAIWRVLLTTFLNYPSYTTPANRLIGYGAIRGDGGMCTITLTGSTPGGALQVTGDGWWIENVHTDNDGNGDYGIRLQGNYNRATHCIAQDAPNSGIYSDNLNAWVTDCEAFGSGIYGIYAGWVLNCKSHHNGYGIQGSQVIAWNLVHNNMVHGIIATTNVSVLNNTVALNGQTGIYNGGSSTSGDVWKNNLIVSNGDYGFNGYGNGPGRPAWQDWDGNAYYNNPSGNRVNMDDTTVNPINGVAPYTNVLDVILTADPFVDAASGDFTLNDVAGGGAACKGSGTPPYADMGCFQSQSSGSTTYVINQQIDEYLEETIIEESD